MHHEMLDIWVVEQRLGGASCHHGLGDGIRVPFVAIALAANAPSELDTPLLCTT